MTATEPGDIGYMRRALALACRGLGRTDPNPAVGCVLVREGRVVGEGFHARAGGPHAEVAALERAGEAASGACAYLTLEPCSHTGRTPPCADRLVTAGITRVVAAVGDPDPRVQGQGLARLSQAGVELGPSCLEDEASSLNAGFFKRARTGRPWVTLKLATSLDGRTATQCGESRWITSEAARADVHRLRRRHSAILTGSATVLADDPSLTVRVPEGSDLQPLRVLLDSSLRTPPGSGVVTGPGRCLLLTGPEPPGEARRALEAVGAEVMALPETSEGGLDLAAVWDELGRREVNSVLVECGATLASSVLAGSWVDRLVTYQAPTLLGAGSRAMLAGTPIESMDQRRDLTILERRELGPDLRITACPDPPG